MTTSPLVRDYLSALHSTAASRLDVMRSEELVDEIREHIEAAIDEGQDAPAVLRRLGSPAEIVAAETPDVVLTSPGPRLRSQETLAILLLLVGLPLIGLGWVVGAVLLWMSDRWSTRDKLIGTLLWPGGLGTFLVAGVVGPPTTSTVEECDYSGACTMAESGLPWWILAPVIAALVIVPILTSIHLFRSAKVPVTR